MPRWPKKEAPVPATVPSGPFMTHEQREEERTKRLEAQAGTTPTGLKRGWCRFLAKRRCYVEGILVEEPGWLIGLSAEASLRVRGNKHLQLVAGSFPETEEVVVRDEYGDPVIRGKVQLTKLIVKDKELLELDGDPIITRPKPNPENDDQALLRAQIGKTLMEPRPEAVKQAYW